MHEDEVERRIEELGRWYGASGPTAAQWRRVVAGNTGAPLTLINFFKLRPSGMESMLRYAAVSGPAMARAGGAFLLTGPFESTLIGEEEDWDLVAIGRYPDRASLLALFADDAYRAAWADRTAAVARQRVVIATG